MLSRGATGLSVVFDCGISCLYSLTIDVVGYNLSPCQKMCDALHYLLDNIYLTTKNPDKLASNS